MMAKLTNVPFHAFASSSLAFEVFRETSQNEKRNMLFINHHTHSAHTDLSYTPCSDVHGIPRNGTTRSQTNEQTNGPVLNTQTNAKA